jgi:hypothetical protein
MIPLKSTARGGKYFESIEPTYFMPSSSIMCWQVIFPTRPMPGNPTITNGFFDFRGSLMIFTNCSDVSDAIFHLIIN